MCCYAFVIASMYRYSWLISFEIFRNLFLHRGVGGWGVSYTNFFWIFIYLFIFTPLVRMQHIIDAAQHVTPSVHFGCHVFGTYFSGKYGVMVELNNLCI